jgi:ParB family transcriptional regulator, chromosome partitioning protein
MSKLDELRRTAGQNVKDSSGADRAEQPGGHVAGGAPNRWQGVERSRDMAMIPVAKIDRDPDQPRQEFDEEDLARLAESLRIRGQLQPIRVRWDEGRGVYVVLAGERRWRAARMADLDRLACVIHEGALTDEEKLAMQLVENALRVDLKPVEQARAYKRLMEARGYSTRELASELHIAQTSVVRTLSLLELPAEVQGHVEEGELAATVAAELTKLPDPALQAEVAQAVIAEGLTRTEVTELVQAVRARRPTPTRRPDPVTVDLGDCTITVRWKKASETTALQALRKAAKQIQERERPDQAA